MKTLKILLLTTCLVGFSYVASAQWQPGAVNETGNTSIVLGTGSGISVTKISDLYFGDIKPVSRPGGSIAINPQTGAVSTVSGNFILSGSPTVAQFDLQGPNEQKSYSYSLPASVVLRNPQGNTMTISDMRVYKNPQSGQAGQGNNTGSGQTNNQGKASIYVGGTLNINANQANGVYSNTSDLKLVIILQ